MRCQALWGWSDVPGHHLIAFALARPRRNPLALEGDRGLRAGGNTVAQLREYRRLMGLDVRCWPGMRDWLGHVVRGDLGDFVPRWPPRCCPARRGPPGHAAAFACRSILSGTCSRFPIGVVSAIRPAGFSTGTDRPGLRSVFLAGEMGGAVVVLALARRAADPGLRSGERAPWAICSAHLLLPTRASPTARWRCFPDLAARCWRRWGRITSHGASQRSPETAVVLKHALCQFLARHDHAARPDVSASRREQLNRRAESSGPGMGKLTSTPCSDATLPV